MIKRSMYVAVVVMCAAALFGPGCRSKKGTQTTDTTTPTGLEQPSTSSVIPDRPPLGDDVGIRIPASELNLANVQFDYDSFQVKESEVAKVQKAADYMKANATVVLVVEGNCDERGSREYNLTLSEQRALAVRTYITGLGIDGQRVQTRSFGKEKPLDPGHNEAAWALNRRAEFAMYRPR